MAHTFNPSTGRQRQTGLWDQGQPSLYSDFQVNWGYRKILFQKNQNQTKTKPNQNKQKKHRGESVLKLLKPKKCYKGRTVYPSQRKCGGHSRSGQCQDKKEAWKQGNGSCESHMVKPEDGLAPCIDSSGRILNPGLTTKYFFCARIWIFQFL